MHGSIARESLALPTFDDVAAAAERLRGLAHVTPVLTSPTLDAATGARVLIKAESLQRTGSFKFRGAYNRLSQIPEGERAAGVVAASSGNHAQGVAEAARLLGIPATIVMPADAPALKIEGVRMRGAKVVSYDRASEDRFEIMGEIAARTGAAQVPPYDDPRIIAGQGVAGLEFAAQAKVAGATLDELYVNVGGGGLMAGVALAFEGRSPKTRLYAVEPAGFDDYKRSLFAGRRLSNPTPSGSIMDALLVQTPGEITYAVNQPRLAGGVVVTDPEAMAAMAFAYRWLKLVLEPGGAASLAAALLGKRDIRGKTVGVIVTGGNVEPALFAKAIGAG